ncbi:helix-turn-helix domain-containing protein [Gluconobacter wancherniae]|uniref:helix-turn-helix domain-containing protein n=1 Tax=Gluconobacter wancherniae TaxID=1307955 RepID=UPI00201341FB|nr:transcriptional regulator [Gluconobacter wancherniae]
MSACDSILQGLNETLVYLEASVEDSVTHQVCISSVDMAAIRTWTGLSQAQFAKNIEVAKGALLNWEHGRRW